jgi:hypothetical protein
MKRNCFEWSNGDRLLDESGCTHAQHLPYLVDSIGKPHAHYAQDHLILGGIPGQDIFPRELRQVTMASGSLRDVGDSLRTGDRPPTRHSERRFRRAVAQLHQLKVLYKPIPTSVADIVRIPSCLEPYLYFDLLISIAFCCSLRFFMPVK